MVLAGVFVTLATLLTSIDTAAFDKRFYRYQYQKLDTAQRIGISEEDLMRATDVLLDYCAGKRVDPDGTGGLFLRHCNEDLDLVCRGDDHLVCFGGPGPFCGQAPGKKKGADRCSDCWPLNPPAMKQRPA